MLLGARSFLVKLPSRIFTHPLKYRMAPNFPGKETRGTPRIRLLYESGRSERKMKPHGLEGLVKQLEENLGLGLESALFILSAGVNLKFYLRARFSRALSPFILI